VTAASAVASASLLTAAEMAVFIGTNATVAEVRTARTGRSGAASRATT
jgi:hypothetical protein